TTAPVGRSSGSVLPVSGSRSTVSTFVPRTKDFLLTTTRFPSAVQHRFSQSACTVQPFPASGLPSVRTTTLNGHVGDSPGRTAELGRGTANATGVPSGEKHACSPPLVPSGDLNSDTVFPSGVSTWYRPAAPPLKGSMRVSSRPPG